MNLKGARIISVKNPAPGLWKVTASSSGTHTLRVTGLSTMYFTSGFGLRPIKSQDEAMSRPLAGQYILGEGHEQDSIPFHSKESAENFILF